MVFCEITMCYVREKHSTPYNTVFCHYFSCAICGVESCRMNVHIVDPLIYPSLLNTYSQSFSLSSPLPYTLSQPDSSPRMKSISCVIELTHIFILTLISIIPGDNLIALQFQQNFFPTVLATSMQSSPLAPPLHRRWRQPLSCPHCYHLQYPTNRRKGAGGLERGREQRLPRVRVVGAAVG